MTRQRHRQSGSALWLILFLLVLAGGGFAVWWFYFQKKDDKPQYQTSTAKRVNVVQAVTATGTLNALVMVQVGSQISGIIQTLSADYNTPVKEGQVVAQLDPSTYKAIADQNQGDLASAEASLELAQLNEKRKRDLVKDNAAPQADLDKAVADLHQAEAMVQIKKAVLEKSKIDLARCTITAPVDGVVIERKVDVGQTVAAAMTAPVLFTIANDLAKMQIEANVSEADIGGVQIGQGATFQVDAFPGRAFEGKVHMVRYAPVTVENVVTYVTVIDVENKKLELRPGMTATVSIVLAKKENVVAIPNAALRFKPAGSEKRMGMSGGESKGGGEMRPKGGRPAHDMAAASPRRKVYVLEDGEPKAVEVELGITDNVVTEVISGLEEGKEVLTSMYMPNAGPMGGSPFGMGGPPRRG